jgi:putative membrane-bound dehydrogenase-like protein
MAASPASERHPALAPDEALTRFQIEPGLRIELVAAEPLVVSPVAFAFETPRRLYVVEGRGYPDMVEGEHTTAGRIALLEDTDGDGRFDRRTEFAAGLGYVNGIMLWRGGMFVTAAPDILYLKDTDGDGVADVRRVVLTGFDATKTAQIRLSHPTLGLDGKVYITCGLNGGKVTSPEHPERAAVVFTGRDGRFDPDTFEFENTGGRGQFGLAFDAFGRRFVSSNRHPVLQVVLEPWHLRRNPYFTFSESMQEVSKVEAEAKVFPVSRVAITADYIPKLMAAPHAGTFTSACGLVVFDGTALTPAHAGNVFICEPAQNLVQRQIFRNEGASLRSEVPERGREFLASTDVWFRPVFLANGPDGALYVADMYRREIDHPRYVPEESRGLLDFESGKDCGRIYRIVKDASHAADLKPPRADTASLVADLEAPEEWWRARAQRLLIERGERDTALVAELTNLSTAGKTPEARTRALWTLRDLQALTPAVVVAVLRDRDAHVREQGVQLAGERAGTAPELLAPLLAAALDANARVRFCAALALGSISDAAAVSALAEIALRDGDDRWTRAAVLSGIGQRLDAFLAALLERRATNPANFAVVMEHLGRVFGVGATPEACRDLLHSLLMEEGDLGWRLATVLGVADGLRGRAVTKSAGEKLTLTKLLAGDDLAALQALFRRAAASAGDTQAPAGLRLSALALLGYSNFATVAPLIAQILGRPQPSDLQLATVRAVERMGDLQGAALLIAKENWSGYTPQVREAVVATLSSRPPLAALLFDAIKAGVVAPAEISSNRRAQLLKHADAGVRQQAEALFKSIEGGDRMEIYRANRALLTSAGDVALGRTAFQRVCAVCHTHRGVGGKVGPDLTGLRNQPADAILLHILVPNYEVAPNYQTLTVVTEDGRTLAGWLAAESEGSVTLRTAFGTEETVMRKKIATFTASGLSLMPDGLEQAMTKPELAGLVAFLKSED